MTDSAVIAEATKAQNRAADPSRSIWVSANAGTGKTRVLTNRILRLLLDGSRAADILAVTYTRAAASEMRNRLFETLADWAVSGGTELEEKLRKVGIEKPERRHHDIARRLFATLLDQPVGIRIETIHAFSQSVLRRFPIEANLQPWFDLATTAQAAGMQQEAIADVLRSGNPAVAAAMKELAKDYADTTVMDEAGILMRHRRVMEAMGRDPDGVARQLFETLGWKHPVGDPDAAADKRIREFTEDRSSDKDLGKAAKHLAKGGKNDEKNSLAIIGWLEADEAGRARTWPAHHRIFHTAEGTLRKILATKSVVSSCPDVVEIMTREAERVNALAKALHGLETARRTFPLLVVARAMVSRYSELKARDGLLDYDDLIANALGLLSDVGGMNWVRYKLDRGINHLLIDEAQDTSPDQWDIISNLAGEFFATEEGDASGEERQRSLFSVGDYKQSIYSFQGAEPELFRSKGESFEEAAKAASKGFDRVGLNASFRSTAPVLRLVDHITEKGSLEGLGEPSPHEVTRQGEGGFVEILDHIDKGESEEPEPYLAKITRADTTDAEIDLARVVVDTLKSWIGTRVLTSRGRTVRAGDILILVRKRDGFHKVLDQQLRLAGLPVAGADRVRLNEDIAVLDLIALGNAVLLPGDDLNLAAVLKSPLFGLSEKDLFRLAHGRHGKPLFQRLAEMADGDKVMEKAHGRLVEWLGLAESHSPYGFFRRVLDDGTRRDFAARLGNHIGDVLAEFLEMARKYEAAFPASMIKFLEFMKETDAEIVRESNNRGENEIRIMTVHGAKGLEAPIVVLPDTLKSRTPVDRILVIDTEGSGLSVVPASGLPARHDSVESAAEKGRLKREAEDDRLFYVAMTRAQDGLLVAGYEAPRRRSMEGSWYERVSDAMDELGAVRDGGLRRLEAVQEGKPSAGEKAAAAPVQPMELPEWVEAAAPVEESPPRPLSPSRLVAEEDSFSPVGRNGSQALERGRLVHRMLEILPGLDGEARRRAAGRIVAMARSYSLTEESARGLLANVNALLEQPATKGLFGPESRAEVPVSGMVEDTVVSGVIDRLLVDGETVTLVDFKTGTAPVEGQGAPGKYVRQLAVYRALMQRIWPDRDVRAGLVYTMDASVLWLDPGEMDAEISRLRERLASGDITVEESR